MNLSLDMDSLHQGLSKRFSMQEIEEVWPLVEEVVSEGLEEHIQGTETLRQALDILVLSARLYLARAEHLKEEHEKGLH